MTEHNADRARLLETEQELLRVRGINQMQARELHELGRRVVGAEARVIEMDRALVRLATWLMENTPQTDVGRGQLNRADPDVTVGKAIWLLDNAKDGIVKALHIAVPLLAEKLAPALAAVAQEVIAEREEEAKSGPVRGNDIAGDDAQ